MASALRVLADSLEPIHGIERVVTGAADKRVLAEDLIATLDLPAFDSAAMDGFALRACDSADGRQLQQLSGRALAGRPYAGRVGAGECVRITTGAPLPQGADTVVMYEDVADSGNHIALSSALAAGRNVRVRGEHVRNGDQILYAGRRLSSADLGLVAASGYASVPVRRRVKLGVLSTGDELNDPPCALPAGGAYDGNRPMLVASLERAGFEVFDLGISADSAEKLSAAVDHAFALNLDALITSGGSALGEADVVRQFDTLQFTALNIRPGRGVLSGSLNRDGRALQIFGLPGNSVAAFVMHHLVVQPLLLYLAGAGLHSPLSLRLPLAAAAQAKAGRVDYRRGRLVSVADRTAVELLREQGSAMLRTVSEADVLAGLGPAVSYAAGDIVEIIPLAALD